MILFFFVCLSSILITLLIMMSVQMIRIEKMINGITDYTEIKVKKLYGKL